MKAIDKPGESGGTRWTDRHTKQVRKYKRGWSRLRNQDNYVDGSARIAISVCNGVCSGVCSGVFCYF